MRTVITILLCTIVGLAAATFKGPVKYMKVVTPPTQDEVTRQQALQRQQGQVGLVPGKTDDAGYAPRSEDDPSAAAIVAGQEGNAVGSNSATDVIKTNTEALNSEAQRPKTMAFGAIWALLAGLLVAVGAWKGLQRFGPQPPEHVLRNGSR